MKKNAIALLAMALLSTGAAVAPTTTTQAKSVSSSYKVQVDSNSANLYNASGEETNSTLPANSTWSLSNIRTIDGKDYYQVSANDYLSSNDSFLYKKRPETIKVAEDHEVSVYDHNFKENSNIKLAAGTKWYSDTAIYTQAGIPFVRVAPDMYVSMVDVIQQSVTSSVN
ncbi:SLAP domain-containing protein [Companilactobacillus insicii]|uniref:SLAP domain-containing protein n=1 Tax=Companilactobacillus insicii TaxID=1732567 RepID=UPI000F786E19|nr:SLAP domain-containing protein [Companilactobacillus insicii]